MYNQVYTSLWFFTKFGFLIKEILKFFVFWHTFPTFTSLDSYQISTPPGNGASLVSSDCKKSAYNAGDPDSNPVLGKPPGEANSSPLQYSCLENPMDREAWWATVYGVAKSRTQLSD